MFTLHEVIADRFAALAPIVQRYALNMYAVYPRNDGGLDITLDTSKPIPVGWLRVNETVNEGFRFAEIIPDFRADGLFFRGVRRE